MRNEGVAVIIDGGVNLPAEWAERDGVYRVPLGVSLADGTPLRGEADVLEAQARGLRVLTSAPSIGDIEAAVARAVGDGHDEACFVTMSSGLSSTYETACLVAGQAAEDGGARVDVIDSRGVDISAGLVAMAAIDAASQGLPVGEVASRAAGAAGRVGLWFAVPSLDTLRAGGRISEVTYRLGGLLSVKPIISCDAAGRFVAVARPRGWGKAMREATRLALAHASSYSSVRVAVCGGGEDGAAAAEEIGRSVGDGLAGAGIWVVDMVRLATCPVALAHAGAGAVGVAVQGVGL